MPKKLVVFCDGTWNRLDETSAGAPCSTNVVRLFEATLPSDSKGNPQIIHYVGGIGTRNVERIRGGIFGYGISDNIKDGYRFILGNYDPDDEIFLFGFSRGAFTARSLAGLIHNLGILKREKVYLINEVYKKYRDRSPEWRPDSPEVEAFRKEHTWGDDYRKIKFLGVWDTVGALGAPYGMVLGWIVDKLYKYRFHDTKLSSSIETACHALAIDEQRWSFRPTQWELSDSHDPKKFEEKWFPGVHSNVGGGYPETGLSDVALEWMANKAKNQGLQVDLQRISEPKFAPDPTEDPRNPQTPWYRLLTLSLVKVPSRVGVVRSENKPWVQYIDWKGNYVRPFDKKNQYVSTLSSP